MYAAEARCQQPKQRQRECLAAAAASVNDAFYDPARARDWLIESLRIECWPGLHFCLIVHIRAVDCRSQLVVMKFTAAIRRLLKASHNWLEIQLQFCFCFVFFWMFIWRFHIRSIHRLDL